MFKSCSPTPMYCLAMSHKFDIRSVLILFMLFLWFKKFLFTCLKSINSLYYRNVKKFKDKKAWSFCWMNILSFLCGLNYFRCSRYSWKNVSFMLNKYGMHERAHRHTHTHAPKHTHAQTLSHTNIHINTHTQIELFLNLSLSHINSQMFLSYDLNKKEKKA